MALGSSRANVLALKREVNEGELVDPAVSTDYTAVQPDVSMTPNFESLENEEIRASIGSAKPIQGLEQPELTFSHYMKASGVEGQEPDYSLPIESAFGSMSKNGTERSTTSGSTPILIKAAAGGTDFARGKAVLIKDATNGFAIRNVLSVATNDLVPAFRLANAPASGVGLGKCVAYAPTNDGHPSFSAHLFRGNGHSKEQMAGCQTTSMAITAPAGGLINATFNAAGTRYYFNAIRLLATEIYLDFVDNVTTRAAVVPARIYRDPYDLADALQTAMNSLGSSNVFTVSFSSETGKYTIASNGSTLSLLWDSGTNAANSIGAKLGFDTSADDTGALTYEANDEQNYAAPQIPQYDPTDPIGAKFLELMIGDQDDNSCFCAQQVDIAMEITKTNVLCICAESGVQQKVATARQVTMTISAVLEKHQAKYFQRMRENAQVAAAFNFGPRQGGNWIPGQAVNFFMPTAVVSSYELTDLDSVIGLNLELTGFVDAGGNGEAYLNFL